MSKDKVETLEKPKRVHQIAKELNIASVEVLDFLKERKYPIKNINIMTKVDEKMYNDILLRFQSEKVSAEKKIEYRRKKLKITDFEKKEEKEVIEIPIEYNKPKVNT